MKRTYRFVEARGTVACIFEDGTAVDVPVFDGTLKHPTTDQLAELLTDPVVVRKYTFVALRKAPWMALKRFPREWLLICLPEAGLSEGRRRALELMLGA